MWGLYPVSKGTKWVSSKNCFFTWEKACAFSSVVQAHWVFA